MSDDDLPSDIQLTDEDLAELQSMGLNMGGLNTGFPEAPSKESVVKFFRDVLNLKEEEYDKISRTGNLAKEEIGRLPLHVRAYLNIANYASSEALDRVAMYMRSKSNIMLNTSLSLKAAFLTLFVTQKKVSRNLGMPSREVKTGLFSSTEKVTGSEEE